jgi:hypothetical protein
MWGSQRPKLASGERIFFHREFPEVLQVQPVVEESIKDNRSAMASGITLHGAVWRHKDTENIHTSSGTIDVLKFDILNDELFENRCLYELQLIEDADSTSMAKRSKRKQRF